MKKLSNKKGFTLIEMLIVVAIIAVLAAVTLPTFSGATKKATDAAGAANTHNSAIVDAVNGLDIEGVSAENNTPEAGE